MRSKNFALLSAAFCSLLVTVAAQAATVSGTVTNKTTGKPSAGDTVVLVDVQANMGEVAKATTDAAGHYKLNEPGPGPYLIRVTHQGAGYFIAAPQGGGPGDLSVYDAAPKVEGISLEDEIIQVEAQNGQLAVTEQYVVHNLSSPKVTEFSGNTFEFALPADAVIDVAEATRPSGLPTMAVPKPLAQKGRYTLNVPIEPDQGDKMTLFEISYHLNYTGSYTFHPSVLMPADNLAVQLPKSMTFTPMGGAVYQSIPQDPALQTFLLKNASASKPLDFTVSGNGAMPRQQGNGDNGAQAAQPGAQPGGGIGEPINTPDPLTKYKWWILGGLGLLLAATAAFLLRKPAAVPAGAPGVPAAAPNVAAPNYASNGNFPGGKNAALLNALKEELFSLESEKLSGTLNTADYAEQKSALETVLKRALTRK
ncbi:MAG TPA: carboxypeptidase-like regulatory domain-containing protein [Terracidiphilus sp.]|jgi:hypothetical protein|nr:carboxypeptidase-like regulatory domain-containing protein [Terracidiphilus sp.]